MQYDVHFSRKFLKSLKRVKQLPAFKPERLKEAIRIISIGETLPVSYRDHILQGDMQEYRECHLTPDILLIYEVEGAVLTLTLINIGSHSQLFK